MTHTAPPPTPDRPPPLPPGAAETAQILRGTRTDTAQIINAHHAEIVHALTDLVTAARERRAPAQAHVHDTVHTAIGVPRADEATPDARPSRPSTTPGRPACRCAGREPAPGPAATPALTTRVRGAALSSAPPAFHRLRALGRAEVGEEQ